MTPPRQTYRFRAEWEHDVKLLTSRLMVHDPSAQVIHRYIGPLPGADCEITVHTTLTPLNLTLLIIMVADSHVMRETLDYADHYTGKRTYTGKTWLETRLSTGS